MSPGKDETRVCGYIRSEFIHWALWRTLMRTEYFLFVHHTTSILAKLSTWCFEHSGGISCSLLVNLNHTDESWKGRNRKGWDRCLLKRAWYKMLLGLIKKIFTGWLIGLFNGSNHSKSISLNNNKCQIQPTLINLHLNE